MNRKTLGLPFGAARLVVSAVFVTGLGFATTAFSQDETTPSGTAPADQAAPADQTAPADQASPDQNAQQPATVPVQQEQQAEAPAPEEKNSTKLDTIEVTGSRIKRSDYETESPVLVIKREDIEKSGLVSIGDILTHLPQASAALSRAFNNGGNGAINIDLRNLGSQRVLVLVNGRRWVGSVNSFNTSGVDLTTIPISIIDSIEVLKDGASAIYGSDAISGVVNIKTRKDFVGSELRAHYDTTAKGDGSEKLVSFGGGTVAGKTSVFLNAEFVDQQPILSGSRPESSVPLAGIPASDRSRGSGFIPNTRTILIPTPQNAQAIDAAAGVTGVTAPCYDITNAVGGAGAPPLPINGALTICDFTLDPAALAASGAHNFIRYDHNLHGYNYAPVNYILTPNQRTSLYSQLNQQLLDNLNFSTELLYIKRKSSQQLAQTPDALGDAFGALHPFDLGYVAKDNPYNPTNPSSPYYIAGTQPEDIGHADCSATGDCLVNTGAVLRRFVETGPRVFQQDVGTYRLGGGFDGNLDVVDHMISWDGGGAYTESNLGEVQHGLINNDHLARASGPLNQCVDTTDPNTGAIVKAPPAAYGCVPFNWFGGEGSLTPDMLKYVTYTAVNSTRQQQTFYYVNGSTEVPEVSKFFAGPLGVAVGGEWRKEAFTGQPDPLEVNLSSSTNSQGPTSGQYSATEAYTELRIPALADINLKGFSVVKELEVSLAGRYSSYTGFGDNLSGKAGLRWKVNDDLLLRSTYSNAFRAPAITDLYLGASQSFLSLTDPCVNSNTTGGDSRDANTAANCTADGASPTSSPSQTPVTFGGNPHLKPETAHTLSVGFVYSPTFLPDFNTYVDWYSIDLKNAIGVIDPDLMLKLCYSSPSADRAFCDQIQRSGTGQLVGVTDTFQNFTVLRVEGIDVNFDWILPLPERFDQYGRLKASLDSAYTSKYDQSSPTAGGNEVTTGAVGQEFSGFTGIPRFKATGSLGWSLGNWEANWETRYISQLTEPCDDAFGVGQGQGAPTGAILENPTPVKSDAAYGLCSNPNDPAYKDSSGKIVGSNKMKATWYHDVQGVYTIPNWNTKVTFGVNNVFNQNPPRSVSAFADSYDKATYLPWNSRTPYLNFLFNF